MNQSVDTLICLNCATPLAPEQRFCGSCGQRVIHRRLTLRDAAHDFIQSLTDVDRSIFVLIGALLLRPGRVARDYIEGRRRRYFGPFGFLVISVAVFIFTAYAIGLDFVSVKPPTKVELATHDHSKDTEEVRRRHEALQARAEAEQGRREKVQAAAAFLNRNFNFVMLAQIPAIALLCLAFFRSAKLNFTEHLVLAAYAFGFLTLLTGLVALPLRYIVGLPQNHSGAALLSFGVYLGYFAFAAVQFYGGKPWWVSIKAALALVLAFLVFPKLITVSILLFSRF